MPIFNLKVTQKNAYDLRKLQATTTMTKKRLEAYRTTAMNILSDYISEQIKGFGKPVPSKFKFGRKDTKGKDSAPDMMLSVKEFNTLIQTSGFKIKQTQVIQEEALPTPDVAFVELKSTMGSQKIDLSQTTVVKEEKMARVGIDPTTEQSVGGTNLAEQLTKKLITERGQHLSDLLWSSALKKTRKNLIDNIRDKFENLVLIQIGDAEKKRKTQVQFFPLVDIIATASVNQKNWDEVYQTRARIKKGREGVTFIAEVKPAFKEKMARVEKDITRQIRALTGKQFKKLFTDYAKKRLEEVGAGKMDINILFGFILGFAKEFERSGFTPFVHRVTVGVGIPGNVTGSIIFPKPKGKKKPQQFISGAQITALVQQRLRKIMPQGPRRGPPLSPTIMTNRTGRFRRSIQVIPRYRANVMRYMYDPIYMSLLGTPYNPDQLVSNTIREVVQSLFGRQFAVIRAQ